MGNPLVVSPDFEFDEMNISAVSEVMNQMMGAASTAMSDFLGFPVNISTPVPFELENLQEFKENHLPQGAKTIVVVRFSLKIEKALESLGEGRIFVIFPEGTRSKDGTLGRAKSGVTIIAAQAKVPVVPVYIQYGRKKFRQNIYISIGEKIPAEHFDVDISDRKMLKQVSSTIMDEIAKLRENMPDVD